jgi:hypothetical protein
MTITNNKTATEINAEPGLSWRYPYALDLIDEHGNRSRFFFASEQDRRQFAELYRSVTSCQAEEVA